MFGSEGAMRQSCGRLNESPSEKEGKSYLLPGFQTPKSCLNESPSEKEGKFAPMPTHDELVTASMKVPPKRKGNRVRRFSVR